MNRLNLIANMLLISVTAAAQRTIVTERAVVRQELELNETPVEQIDSSLNSASHLGLPTSLAVKNYVDSVAFVGGGSADTITFAAGSGPPIDRSGGETLTIAGAGIATTSASGTTITVTATEVDGSVTNEKDTVATLIQDSILIYSLSGSEVGRDTIRATGGGGASLPSDNVTGTGTTNRTALWTAANTIGNSYLLQSADALTLDAGKVLRITGHTTAGRPTATAGFAGYNTTNGWFEGSNGTSWWYFPRTSLAGGLFTPGSVPFAGADGSLVETTKLSYNSGTETLLIRNDLSSASKEFLSMADNFGYFKFIDGSSGNTFSPTIIGESFGSGGMSMQVNALSSSGSSPLVSVYTYVNGLASTSRPLFGVHSTFNLRFIIDKDGNVGVRGITPTARLHLPGGTATAGTSSLKIIEGVNTTTPEDGAINHVADRLNFTSGSTVNVLAHMSDLTPLYGSGAPAVAPRFNGDRYFDYTNAKWYSAWDNEDGDGTGDGLDAEDWIILN